MENWSSDWDQLWFNIFTVCHRVQTLTQTTLSVLSETGLDPLVIHLETKTGHMYGHTPTCM